MPSYSSDAVYFQYEGKDNLADCLAVSMAAIIRNGLSTLVVFTAKGEGLEAAINLKAENPVYKDVRLVGVTFPQGKVFAEREGRQPPTRIEPELLKTLSKEGIPLVKARLPFDPIWSVYPTATTLGQEMSTVGNVFNIFGGGMGLCIQAAMMACDSGEVDWGEHIVTMSADTALVVRAAPTDHFMTDLIVREILCKPLFLTISRREEFPPSLSEEESEDANDVALLGVSENSDDAAESE